MMQLAGLRVPNEDVRELAGLVDEPTRDVLEKALELGTVVLVLSMIGSGSFARSTIHRRRRLPSFRVPCSRSRNGGCAKGSYEKRFGFAHGWYLSGAPGERRCWRCGLARASAS